METKLTTFPTKPVKCESCSQVREPYSWCPTTNTAWCKPCHKVGIREWIKDNEQKQGV